MHSTTEKGAQNYANWAASLAEYIERDREDRRHEDEVVAGVAAVRLSADPNDPLAGRTAREALARASLFPDGVLLIFAQAEKSRDAMIRALLRSAARAGVACSESESEHYEDPGELVQDLTLLGYRVSLTGGHGWKVEADDRAA